jgi:hypothetical protein
MINLAIYYVNNRILKTRIVSGIEFFNTKIPVLETDTGIELYLSHMNIIMY